MGDPGQPAPARPRKSAGAFRTIGEVAGELGLPTHVLRFWETKFPQLRPMKRSGGRRYYRPEDILLLRRIREWLYQDGYTIRGVQQLLDAGPPAATMSRENPGDAGLSAESLPGCGAETGLSAEAATRPDADAAELLPPAPPPPGTRGPASLNPETRAELEEIRRDLRQARAVLENLLRPSRTS
ncbi:MAG: MerR family transcriptional regulator [Alphaproteobacteria bacterium]